MTNYSGEEPCSRCFHKKVCEAKKCLNEIQYSTTHPYFNIQIECTEFYNERLATIERLATMFERIEESES